MTNLLLFDIDSVLLEPNGYWASIQATLGLYARHLGYGEGSVPTREDIQVFEACGLTSEWDSCPTCIAALLLDAASRGAAPPAQQIVDWLFQPTLPWPGANGAPPFELPADYFAGLARRVRDARQAGERSSSAALRVLLARAPDALHAVLHALLDDTHDMARAPVTQIFQQFSLGHQLYGECYSLAPCFEGPSLLAQHDRSLLSAEARAQIRALVAHGQVHGASLYTARPSRPPRDTLAVERDYSPEAEIAAEVVGLDDLPLVGFGSVRWLAAQRGQRPDVYVKPSPVQALAAIGAALGGNERVALEAAAALVEEGTLHEPFTALREQPARVYVFEDTERGARAVLHAVERLRAFGCDVTGAVVGIAALGGVKWQALAPVATVLCADVNEGIAWLAADVGSGQQAGGSGQEAAGQRAS